ncbi:MAG: hypothetical protein KatS3mg130_1666 [Candidatus Sumerlaea sp.]|jgi:hypothetical protein|nr:MAG: hypothetical protein KatS3mg130_1666 [Candidatus Sumerlaea sp.]
MRSPLFSTLGVPSYLDWSLKHRNQQRYTNTSQLSGAIFSKQEDAESMEFFELQFDVALQTRRHALASVGAYSADDPAITNPSNRPGSATHARGSA